MQMFWEKWLATHAISINFDDQLANQSYNKLRKQVESVMKRQAWMPLTNMSLICISGEEAGSFLQGQFSNDIRQLKNHCTCQFGSYSSPQGRMLANFLIWYKHDRFYLMLSSDLAARFVKRLSMYVLRAKVSIEDVSGQLFGVCVLANNSEGFRKVYDGATVYPWQMFSTVDGIMQIGLPSGAVLFLGNEEQIKIISDQLINSVLTYVSPMVWRLLDISAGILWITESTYERFVPQMANMLGVGAINFTKGCYTGQEVVARAQYRGSVKRHLYRLQSGIPIQSGDKLYSTIGESGTAIGQVASVSQIGPENYQLLAVMQESAINGKIYLQRAPEHKLDRLCRMDVLIRPYQPDDQAQVMTIWDAAFRYAHPFLSEMDFQQQYVLIEKVYFQKADVFVAEQSHKVVGLVGLLDANIGGLFIHPDKLRQGIGQALLTYAATWHNQLTVEVYTMNKNAMAFYLSNGFVVSGSKAQDDKGRPLEITQMFRHCPSVVS